LAVYALCLVGAVEFSDGASRPAPSPRVCFPDRKWNEEYGTPDAFRPCARIVTVYEDGSVEVAVSDANGTVRWTAGIGARDR
jgi:hypothetical protein